MDAPESNADAAAAPESSEKCCSVLIESPLTKLFAVPNIYSLEDVPSLKESLKTIPELCHYTSYHFEVQRGGAWEVLSESVPLSDQEFAENSVLRMVQDEYTPFLLQQHVQDASSLFQLVSILPEVDQEIHNLPASIQSYSQIYTELTEQLRQRAEAAETAESQAAPAEGEAASAPAVADADAATDVATAAVPAAPQVDAPEEGVVTAADGPLPLESDFAKIKEAIVKQKQESSELLDKFPLELLNVDLSLSHFFETPLEKVGFDTTRTRPIVKSIRFSGWNPVPANRKVLGDLGYIEVETLENEVFILTSTPSGFYVNKSRRDYFDPTPSSKPCHSKDLVELLRQVSPEFKKQYPSFLQSLQTDSKTGHRAWDSIVSMKIPDVVKKNPWMVVPADTAVPLTQKHQYTLESKRPQLHEWTEEFQSILALPTTEPSERSKKECVLHQLYLMFTEACQLGAVAIVDGAVERVTLSDGAQGAHYIYQNILFTKIDDGSAMSRKESNQHLLALRNVNAVRDESLHAPLATIVDYMSQRYLSEALLPGQLQGSTKLVYGLTSDGSEFKSDPTVHEKLVALVNHFGLGETSITVGGQQFKVAGSPYTQVVQGSDGLNYLTHLGHFYPHNAQAETEKIVDGDSFIRPELVQGYYASLFSQNREKAEQKAQETHEDQEIERIPPFRIELSRGCPVAESTAANDEFMAKLQSFLDECLNDFRVSLITEKVPCTSCYSLSQVLHAVGINMHYLGPLSTLLGGKLEDVTSRVHFFIELCEMEMVARACKHVASSLFKHPHAAGSAALIYSSLLNAVLGTPGESTIPALLDESSKVTRPNKRAMISGLVSQKMVAYMQSVKDLLAPESLWDQIESRIASHFHGSLRILSNPYKNAQAHASLPVTLKCALLHAICEHLGVQLFQREYAFVTSTPVLPEDIAGSCPLIKTCLQNPLLLSVSDLVETLNNLISVRDYGQAYCKAVMMIALVFQETSHADHIVVTCLEMMALACSKIRDYEGAEVHQKQAIALETELSGEGNVELVSLLDTLAQYLSQQGKTREAMNCLKRSLYLSDVITGEHNLHNISGYLRLGSVMTSIGNTPFAIECYKEALTRANTDINTQIPILRNLSISEALVGNMDAAIHYEGVLHEVSKALSGEESEGTQQSGHLLERFRSIKAEFDKK